MYYGLTLSEFPTVKAFYSVKRNTVWEIVEREHILIVIKAGRCRISLSGEEYSLAPGEVFYIPAETAYTRRPIDGEECTMTYIHFTTSSAVTQEDPARLVQTLNRLKAELDTEILSGESHPSYPNIVYLQNRTQTLDSDQLNELLSGINLYSANRPLTCSLQASVNLCGILLMLSQNTTDTILTGSGIHGLHPVPEKLKAAVSYIAHNYSEPLSLETLATHCNVSKQQMIRYFRETLNTTPNRYIAEYKISRAKEQLFYHPQLTVKEIAAELGFENQHYFSRVFMQLCGETPSHYRNRTVNYGKTKK